MKALDILSILDEVLEESKDYDFKYDSKSHKNVKVAIQELLLIKYIFNSELMELMLDNNKNGKYDLIIQEIESMFESK
jgi:hypothetical protein